MCNACGFVCCGYDVFEKCGCDWCDCENCWDDVIDDDDDDEWDGPPIARFTCEPVSQDRIALGQILSDALNGKF